MSIDVHAGRNNHALPSFVPRIISIGLDMFGSQVLTAFREHHLPNVLPGYTRLTIALQYDSTKGFIPFALDPLAERSQADPLAPAGVPGVDNGWLDNLVQQLHQSRQKIAAQGLRSDLLQHGYRVGQITEVYLFLRGAVHEHIDSLRAVAMTIRAYLHQYDPVRVTAFVCLADIENPLAAPEARANVLKMLDQVLTMRFEKGTALDGEPILDRGYIVSQETLSSQFSGQGCIPDSDLAHRTAGFLAALYLDGLRQPMTAHEHHLFGAHHDLPTTSDTIGLCHLFGYADLRFEVSHILDWCATRHAAIVLNKELLSVTNGSDTPVEMAERHARFLRSIQEAGLPVSTAEQVNYLLKDINVDVARQDTLPVAWGADLLNLWRAHRHAFEQHTLDVARRMEEAGGVMGERYLETFTRMMDEEIASGRSGLARAESLIGIIETWCTTGREELVPAVPAAQRLAPHRTKPALATGSSESLQASWRQLSNAAQAYPSRLEQIGQAGLIALFALVLFPVVPLGPILAMLAVVCALVWFAYIFLWLPVRLRRAQEQYRQQLHAWHHTRLNDLARRRMVALYDQLGERFAHSSVMLPEGGVMRVEVAAWRERLQRAAEQCAKKVRHITSGPALLRSGETDSRLGSTLALKYEDFQAYYDRLTRWEAAEIADQFLKSVLDQPGGWQNLSVEQVIYQVIHICRRHYEQQQDTTRSGLDLEYHLLDMADAGSNTVANLLAALVEGATPMARLQRMHGYWERPTLRLLIVHNPEESIFRDPARQLNLQIVGGAHERQVICICTEHLVPARDLAMTYDWRQVLGSLERAQSHA